MSHSYAQNHIHLVFSTKNREKILARDFLPRLWAYTAAVCKNHDLLTFAVGGMEDHIHLLFRLPPTMPLANAVSPCEIQFLKLDQGTKKELCMAGRVWSF